MFGNLIVGALLVSAYGIPAVMYHTATINGTALALAILSPSILFGTMIVYSLLKMRESEF